MWQKNVVSTFWVSTCLLWISALALYFVTPKGAIEWWWNDHHTSLLDHFFKVATFVGDGVFATVFLILLLFFSIRETIFGTLTILSTTIVVQYLKNYTFWKRPRPILYFKEKMHLVQSVDGVEIHSYNSFPSGHTTTGFVLACLMVYVWHRFQPRRSHWFGVLFAGYGTLVGLSRIYLFQHFLEDVLAGVFIACFFSFIIRKFLNNRIPEHLHRGLLN